MRSKFAMRTAVSLGLSGIGVMAIILSATMSNPLQQPLGPGYVPLCVSVSMAALCLRESFLALRELRSKRPSRDVAGETDGEKNSMKLMWLNSRWLIATALIAVSLLVWSVGGYLLGMMVGVFGLTSVDRKIKPFAGLPFAALLALALWFLFKVVLKTDLG